MEDKIKGEESLLYIKKNGKWLPAACIISCPFSEDSETIKTTTRDSGGWETERPTLQSYTLSPTGLIVKDDPDSGNNIVSYRELRNFKRNRTLIEWKIITLAGWYVDSGKAHITSISFTDEPGAFMTFSATLKGYGAPVEGTEKIYILSTEDHQVLGDKDYTVIKTE